MNDSLYGELSVIYLKGGDSFAREVDDYLKLWRQSGSHSFIVDPDFCAFPLRRGKVHSS